MIIVKLIGGLGNQLFQYALGRHLALRNNTELKLDITGFEEYKLHRYSLSHFNIVENFATMEEVVKFQKYKRRLGKKWFLYNKFIADEHKYAQERQFHFNPRILDTQGDAYLDGFWQTEKYFKDIESIIRKEVAVKTPFAGKDAEVAKEIDATSAVMMHIRRGDYVSNQATNEYHGTCGLDYYRTAATLIAEKVASPHFFIFSDDHIWVKENIILDGPVTYVDHNNADKNYEDLRLMSLCKHAIIANSSFGWWGAWLSQNPGKIVIGPSKWFNNPKKKTTDTSDVLPKEWIKI
ncbi:MAG: Glycosyl transferase, family 11 [Parcubacteria group bacterium GW2011_GWA1_47_8]|nr:MAG: Glycosyl transferase, family 11 [Parcubacteria group bacterium GW2011_GWA1_47_8]